MLSFHIDVNMLFDLTLPTVLNDTKYQNVTIDHMV